MRLTPPILMTLEQAIAYIDDDELVEVTPQIDPPAQAPPRPQRAQARQPRRRGRRGLKRRGPIDAADTAAVWSRRRHRAPT